MSDEKTEQGGCLCGAIRFLPLPKTPAALRSSGSTLVSMMGSPGLGVRDDLSRFARVCHPWIGRILVEHEVGS